MEVVLLYFASADPTLYHPSLLLGLSDLLFGVQALGCDAARPSLCLPADDHRRCLATKSATPAR